MIAVNSINRRHHRSADPRTRFADTAAALVDEDLSVARWSTRRSVGSTSATSSVATPTA